MQSDYVTPVADGDDTVASDSASAVAKARSGSTGSHRKRRGRRRPVEGTSVDAGPGAITGCWFLGLIHDIHCTNTAAFLNVLNFKGGPYACSLRCMCFWCCRSASDEAGKHGAGAMAGTAAPYSANTATTAPQRRHHLRRAAESLQVCLVR
jgi:hypothetical protein